MSSIKGTSSSSQAGPSTLSPPLHRTSSSPNPTIHPSASTSRLLPRPKLPSPSHSSTEPSSRPSKPITTRSLGPSSASSRRPSSLHASNLNPTQPRPRLASSGSAHLPTSVSLNNLEPPPPPGSDNGSRRGASPKPNHRPSASAGSNQFLDATPLPSPSIFASNFGSRRSSFLGSVSGDQPSEGGGGGAGAGQIGLGGAAGGKTLYRAGFQPKGVWRARTGEFVEVRMRREEGRRGEERRLGRRLEKLIELHFSPVAKTPIALPPPAPKAPARRSSSAFLLDFESLKNPGDLWRGLKERSVGSSTSGSWLGGSGASVESKRAAEQGIVKWEEDSTVKKCPICTSSFNLANRKHHCRLCGRIVCALPATPVPLIPTTSNPRKETCSLLVVADWKSGRCEEVEEGFVGWLKVEGSASGSGEKGGGEMKIQGVRICRDCWSVVSRRQYLLDATRVPAFTKLYEALRLLQQDIEDSLPEFRELLLNLQAPSATPPSPSTEKEASLLRLSLLETFAAYDSLSKRIRSLPCEKGSGQDRLQKSIAGAAAAFVQREMAPLQSLPKLKKKGTGKANVQHSKLSSDDGLVSEIQLDSVLAMTLQPLLEQEAQLESFIRDAESQRKFEDAAALKLSLAEIRQEVQKIIVGTT